MKYKELMDPELIELIFQGAYQRLKLIQAIQSGTLAERTVTDYQYQIRALEVDLDEMRCHATYYHEASALDNIDVIGWENFLNMEATMNPRIFKTSILNEEDDFVEGAWYADLDEEKHTYTPTHTSWTIERGYDRDRMNARDCRHDAEILPSLPIDIAMDYGGKFNCLAVGQLFNDLFRIDNGFHATWPQTTADVVKQFTQYYAQHRNKTVHYYYDHTALDRHGASSFSYYDTVYNTLYEAGWNVVPVDIGQTAAPKLRYEMFSSLLRQAQPPVMWNPDNCKDMLASMKLVQIKDGRNGIEKNKKLEKSESLEDQVHAPHYSDAVDTLVWGRLNTTGAYGSIPMPSLMT
jgi:hypothetical protein